MGKFIGILCVALVLVGAAVAFGIAFTPALCTVAAFVSAVLVLVGDFAWKRFSKSGGAKPNA